MKKNEDYKKMDIINTSYSIVKETDNPQIKRKYWDMAIGLNEVDNLKPSKYLQELKEENIEGTLPLNEVEEIITKYHTEKNHIIEDEKECDIVSTRIVKILESESKVKLTATELKNIHKQLFKDIYGFNGKFRKHNIYKEEFILNSDTVKYDDSLSIVGNLRNIFEEQKSYIFKNNRKEILDNISSFTTDLWEVHPFMEGNTRTTAVFIEKYLKNNLGFDVDNSLFKKNAKYFRNALVRACYSNASKGVFSDKTFLNKFYENLLFNGNNELKSRELICFELYDKKDKEYER